MTATSPAKILRVAVREFVATALTKGFAIGVFVVPSVALAVVTLVLPRLVDESAPRAEGSVALIDASGAVADRLSAALAAAATSDDPDAPRHELEVEPLPPGADAEAEKQPLAEGDGFRDGGRLALVVLDEHAVEPDAAGGFGGFDLFVRPGLDDRVLGLIRETSRAAIRDARIERSGLDPARVLALASVAGGRATEVTGEGERGAVGQARLLLQFGFMFLLMMAVFVGGQYLLTTTIEEKSSRVVELLLSATSPLELMTGKILGQLGVGLVLVAVYGGVAVSGLSLADRADTLDAASILWFLAFFFTSYLTVGALLAAIGAAVNELREAQSLMTPVLMVLGVPYLLWFPIARSPNGAFAVVTSFVPVVGPFTMILRVLSSEPPPFWQPALVLLIAVITAAASIWLAAKVFRVGLLMFGKPPSLGTLIKWVRMA